MGPPTTLPYAFIKNEGGTPSSETGPLVGVDGSGAYLYAETSSPRVEGDRYTLAYNGAACSNIGQNVSNVAFHYHMHGATMGELRVTNAAGEVVWSLSGSQGDSWQAAVVDVDSPSFGFEYRRDSSWTGDGGVGAGDGELHGGGATAAATATAAASAAAATWLHVQQ